MSGSLSRHRLRREIIATATTNSLVNRMGPAFALRAREDTGADTGRTARAYTIAREVFDMRDLWSGVEELDNRVPAQIQYAMMYQTSRLLRHMTYWFLAHHVERLDIDKSVSRLGPGIARLGRNLSRLLVGSELQRYHQSRSVASREPAFPNPSQRASQVLRQCMRRSILSKSRRPRTEMRNSLAAHTSICASASSLDWIREQIEGLAIEGHWQAVARGTLRDNLYSLQRQLTAKALAARPSQGPDRGGRCMDRHAPGARRLRLPDRQRHARRHDR